MPPMSEPDNPVGRRMTIRYNDNGQATDVVARVLSATDLELTVEDRLGEIVVVRRDQIIASRFVPDRPVRSRPASAISAADLLRVASRGWPAVESERLGDWELRASSGFTGRANSLLATGDPGDPVPNALDKAIDFYQRRNLRPLAQVVEGSAEAALLAQNRWRQAPLEMPGAITQVADLADRYDTDSRVTVQPVMSDGWLKLNPRAMAFPDVAPKVIAAPGTVGFATVGDTVSNAVVAAGRVAVTGEWAGLTSIEVDPTRRNEGLGRAVVTALLAWATEHGADKAYLQVLPDNTAALALYEPFGFTTHSAYRYLSPGGV